MFIMCRIEGRDTNINDVRIADDRPFFQAKQ